MVRKSLSDHFIDIHYSGHIIFALKLLDTDSRSPSNRYNRRVAVVPVTALNIKVLSTGTYCFVISLMTSWAAQPPVLITKDTFVRHKNVALPGRNAGYSPINAATACNSAAPYRHISWRLSSFDRLPPWQPSSCSNREKHPYTRLTSDKYSMYMTQLLYLHFDNIRFHVVIVVARVSSVFIVELVGSAKEQIMEPRAVGFFKLLTCKWVSALILLLHNNSYNKKCLTDIDVAESLFGVKFCGQWSASDEP